MHILLLGSGGREHALAWKIAGSPLVTKLWCAPGNAGIAREAECVALDVANHAAVIDFCKQNAVELVVVGPEAPLCAGIVDDLESAGIKAFGPTKAAARLEGSKGFTKDLCRANNIPTAAYERFDAVAPAKAYLRARGAPIEAIAVSGWRVAAEVERQAREHDIVLIDSPPHAETEARIAVRAGRLVIVPVQPSPIDLWATRPILDLARAEKIPALLVLNRVPARAKLTGTVREAFDALDVPLANAQIGNRVALAAAIKEGLGILEYGPSSAAAREIKALATEVLERCAA